MWGWISVADGTSNTMQICVRWLVCYLKSQRTCVAEAEASPSG